MILGKICGKVTTTHFKFIVGGSAKKFDYIQVMHPEYDYVLGQIVEIERTEDSMIAKCINIGYKDPADGHVKQIRTPFDPGTEVLIANDDFIREIIKLEDTEGAFIGKLEGKDVKIYLDLKKLLTKHVAVLAKSGAGKSYSVGVLLEEIIERKVPLLIIDPHGEYHELRNENDAADQIRSMVRFGISPKSYRRQIQEYGDLNYNDSFRPLKLNEEMSTQDLLHIIPAKLSSSQMAILYNAIKYTDKPSFTNLLYQLETEENNAKVGVISVISYLESLKLFGANYTPYNELIQPGKCSILNLKGINPEIQEIIVYKLLRDLFEERKKNKIPPFFAVIEEAHNFCPERSFREAKSSKVIRDIASEGRKFGLGLCVISQRPARIEKNVISQCTTQIILKVTNPNDLKAIGQSVEGLSAEAESEIKNLPIGTALITGLVDIPLFVNIRPRKTKHGGEAVEILKQSKDEEFFEKIDEFKEKNLLPIIKPKITKKDLALMSGKTDVKTILVPGEIFVCDEKNGEFKLLVDMVNGKIIMNIDTMKEGSLPDLEKLEAIEIKVLKAAFGLKNFSFEELVKKSGIAFDASQIALKKLMQNRFVVEEDGSYQMNPEIIFSKLSKHACHEKIEFSEIGYDKKLKKEQNLDKIKRKLSKFTTIKDMKECFIVSYDA